MTQVSEASPLPAQPSDLLSFVLDRPRHAGNVGACARALRTMGWQRLVLVQPLESDVTTHADAVAYASRSTDVLAAARECASLPQALDHAQCVIAMTGKTHSLAPPALTLEAACALAVTRAAQGEQVAFVFGNERTGLDNAGVRLCHYVCTIDTVADYDSLNLAQSVMLVSATLRRLWREGVAVPARVSYDPLQSPAATAGEVHRLLQHWESGLVKLGVLDPEQPKFMMARLSRLFARAQLEHSELQLLHGIAAAFHAKQAVAADPDLR